MYVKEVYRRCAASVCCSSSTSSAVCTGAGVNGAVPDTARLVYMSLWQREVQTLSEQPAVLL